MHLYLLNPAVLVGRSWFYHLGQGAYLGNMYAAVLVMLLVCTQLKYPCLPNSEHFWDALCAHGEYV